METATPDAKSAPDIGATDKGPPAAGGIGYEEPWPTAAAPAAQPGISQHATITSTLTAAGHEK